MIPDKLPSALLLAAAILPLSVSPAQAAPLSQQEQLDQSRAQEAARQERLHQERTEVDTPPLPSSTLPADETVRFPIAKVVLENESGMFYFLRHIARDYEGRKLSLKEINEAVGKMNRELMQRGFFDKLRRYPRAESLGRNAPPCSAGRTHSFRALCRWQ